VVTLAPLVEGLDRQSTKMRAVRVGERDVGDLGAFEEGVGPAPGPVDELVGQDEVAW